MSGQFLTCQPRLVNGANNIVSASDSFDCVFYKGWTVDKKDPTTGYKPKYVTLPAFGVGRSVGPFGPVFALSGSSLSLTNSNGIGDFLFSSSKTRTMLIVAMVGSLSQQQPLLFKGTSSNTHWSLYVNTDGSLHFDSAGFVSSTIAISSAAGIISVGKWYMISVTSGPSGVLLHVNGVQVASGGGVRNTSDSTFAVTAGFSYTGSFVTASSVYFSHFAVSSRSLSVGELLAISANPELISLKQKRDFNFLPDTNGVITIINGDDTTTGWTATPGPNFYSMVNEFTANDSDYITGPFAGTGNPITMKLANPLAAGSWNIRFRAQYVGSFGSSIQVTLLDSGNNSVGTTIAEPLNTTIDTHLLAIETSGIATKIRISSV